MLMEIMIFFNMHSTNFPVITQKPSIIVYSDFHEHSSSSFFRVFTLRHLISQN